MNRDNQGHMIQSEAVNTQLKQFEQQNPAHEKNKKGSTNQIQPMSTDDDITQ
ncbi:hypothetical protein [Bacillus sp. V3-13]|uniref:hypothetical protein n=1 Tax=Bacillus sp. V3-13 TaxID=2053728 RepID=UPI0015E092E8|nr:hypothetical protein [Bacillus sp. V3-13]